MKLLVIFPLMVSIASGIAIDGGATLVGPDEPGTLIKGPSSKATVKGPSGKLIIAGGDTGAVSSGPKAGGVVNAAGPTPGVIAQTIPLEPVATPILEPVPVVAAPALPLKLVPQQPIEYIETYEEPKYVAPYPIPIEYYKKPYY